MLSSLCLFAFCPTVRTDPTACVLLHGSSEYSEDADAKRSFTTCLKCGKQYQQLKVHTDVCYNEAT